MITLSDVEVNRLAQLFYEASGISLPSMTDKPLIVAGLRAVFAAVDAHDRQAVTGPQHYREAQRILSGLPGPGARTNAAEVTSNMAIAQVHATLALAAATVASELTVFSPDEDAEQILVDWSKAVTA